MWCVPQNITEGNEIGKELFILCELLGLALRRQSGVVSCRALPSNEYTSHQVVVLTSV